MKNLDKLDYVKEFCPLNDNIKIVKTTVDSDICNTYIWQKAMPKIYEELPERGEKQIIQGKNRSLTRHFI